MKKKNYVEVRNKEKKTLHVENPAYSSDNPEVPRSFPRDFEFDQRVIYPMDEGRVIQKLMFSEEKTQARNADGTILLGGAKDMQVLYTVEVKLLPNGYSQTFQEENKKDAEKIFNDFMAFI